MHAVPPFVRRPAAHARSRRARRLGACSTAALVLCVACAPRGRTPPAPDPDPERARAALATLYVDNQTAQQIAISYRIAGRTDGRVGIGRVPAGSTAEMAPVPAGEPLILVARTTAGAELTLPPRTFAMDSAWTWRIDRSARFVPPETAVR